jgi:hypothetical protein
LHFYSIKLWESAVLNAITHGGAAVCSIVFWGLKIDADLSFGGLPAAIVAYYHTVTMTCQNSIFPVSDHMNRVYYKHFCEFSLAVESSRVEVGSLKLHKVLCLIYKFFIHD